VFCGLLVLRQLDLTEIRLATLREAVYKNSNRPLPKQDDGNEASSIASFRAKRSNQRDLKILTPDTIL